MNHKSIELRAAAVYSILGIALGVACSSASGEGPNSSGGAGGAGSDAGPDAATGGGGPIEAGQKDSDLNEDTACAVQTSEATLVERPVDIVFIVDNSCSMLEEINAIRSNINVNFASVIQASGVDHRVVMLSGFKSPGIAPVCIGEPLNSQSCAAQGNTPASNPPDFFHYDRVITSVDAWCALRQTFSVADPHGHAPQGLDGLLREEAFKVFVNFGDGRTGCAVSDATYSDNVDAAAAATKFDGDLQLMSPAQFIVQGARNYVWHSVMGIASKPGNAPYLASESLQTTNCPSAADIGAGDQELSRLTGGLRFSVCEGIGYDALFETVAQQVLGVAAPECEFQIPTPPGGGEVDPSTIQVEYTPGDGSGVRVFAQVDSLADCKAERFYTEGGSVKLCEQTCDIVSADSSAKVRLLYGCPPPPPR